MVLFKRENYNRHISMHTFIDMTTSYYRISKSYVIFHLFVIAGNFSHMPSTLYVKLHDGENVGGSADSNSAYYTANIYYELVL